jgi:polysaccharide deacetylase 2 family uncharacterized protein YibQ
MLKRQGAALLALLRGWLQRLSLPGLGGVKAQAKKGGAALTGLGRGRLLWLAGSITLVVAGLVLALVTGGGKPGPSEQVEVALPPVGAKPALLAPAPDPALVEDSPTGPLPIIGPDGRQAWQVYARPFDASDKRPRVALIVTGIGLDHDASQAALDRLPGAVTLSFDPYAGDIKDMVANARGLGHEVLISLPMEPPDYPRQDPGPLTLLVSLDSSDNLARLNHLMGESTGYVGLVAAMGDRFTQEKQSLLPIIESLKTRGLMLVDNKPPETSVTGPLAQQVKLPWAGANRFVNAETDPAGIDQALADLEAQARRSGSALGLATLSPALLDRALAWVPALDGRGIALAPASAIANRQTIPPAGP